MEPNGACLGKAVLPATSLLGLRPTSGLWSTVGIDVSVHFRLFVNTDLVMLLLYWTRLIQIACARFGYYYSLCFTHSSNDNNSYKKKPGWLTDWDEKGIPCTCNTFQALLPYYRYSYTSERSDDVFAYIHIVRICKVRIKYIQMILNTFLKTILKGLNLNLGHRLIKYKVFIFSDFFLIFENTAQNCWVVFHSSQCKSIWFFLIDNFERPIKNEKKSKKSQKKTTLNFQRYDRKCV